MTFSENGEPLLTDEEFKLNELNYKNSLRHPPVLVSVDLKDYIPVSNAAKALRVTDDILYKDIFDGWELLNGQLVSIYHVRMNGEDVACLKFREFLEMLNYFIETSIDCELANYKYNTEREDKENDTQL